MTAIKHRQIYTTRVCSVWIWAYIDGNNENIIAMALVWLTEYKAHILSCIVIIFCVFVGYDSRNIYDERVYMLK